MKKNKDGRIINISSIYAMGGSQLASHYAASKSATRFIQSWARELAPWRIKVNAVAPGFIVNGMTEGSNPPEKIAEREKLMPLENSANRSIYPTLSPGLPAPRQN